jgi:hypothetical protein
MSDKDLENKLRTAAAGWRGRLLVHIHPGDCDNFR